MKTAIIFDLDGTLLNTLDDLHVSVNETLKNFGFPERTIDEVRSFVGNGVPKLVERALPTDTDGEKFLSALEFFKAHYGKHCKDKTHPYDGIIPSLIKLKSMGYLTGVVSNKVHFATEALCFEYFGGLIDICQGQTENVPVKPSPISVLRVMQKLDADKAIYIGDSEVDIQTAKNAGIPCISVSWGFKDREFLLSHGAQDIADSTDQMMQFILSANGD